MQRHLPKSMLPRIIVLVAVFGLLRFAGTLIASSKLDQTEPSVRLVSNGDGVFSTPKTAAFDFGTHSAEDASPVMHIFVLQNKTDHALTIDLLRPSCGCITAVVADPAARSLPYVVMPGKSVPVQVTLVFETAGARPIEKEVSVFLHGQVQAATVLALKGMVGQPSGPSRL